MKLPDIHRGPVQDLGRHDISGPGRTAAAFANAANQIGNVAVSWINAETDMELAESRSEGARRLSEYSNDLMQKDHVTVESVEKLGVIYDNKDVRTIQNDDGTESRMLPSQSVMTFMYDAKSKEIYDSIYDGMKHRDI